MATKIRRIDFSPGEYLQGVSGLTFEQQGVYWAVCSSIYDLGEPIKNDAQWIARRAAGCSARRVRARIDDLLAMGKLRLTTEGRLTNGRTEVELSRAVQRIFEARKASELGVSARKLSTKSTKVPNRA